MVPSSANSLISELLYICSSDADPVPPRSAQMNLYSRVYKGHEYNRVESIGNYSLEDTCRQCASHLVHHMYGGSSTSGGTCQIWHAIPQEWWGRSSPRECTHR